MPGEQVGVVLSGSTIHSYDFVVLEGREDRVREGKYFVAVDSGGGGKGYYIGLVEYLDYYHEFYEAGDVFLEAVRRGHRPPEEVARRYLRARARVLGYTRPQERGLAPLSSPPRPPRPGSPVYEVTGSELEAVYGFNPEGEPPGWVVELGHLYGYQSLPAPLDLRSLTMHMAVVGTTGSGKSNTVGVLVEELGGKRGVDVGITRLPVTVPVFIVDANGDYVDYYCDPDLVPSYRRVYRIVLEGSPAWSTGYEPHPRQVLLAAKIDLDMLEPHELAELIVGFYHRGSLESAGLQIAALQSLLEKYVEEGHTLSMGFQSREGLRRLESILDSMVEAGEVHRSTAGAVRRQLRVFQGMLSKYRLLPELGQQPPTLGEDFVDQLTQPEAPGLAILDYTVHGSPAPLEVKQFLVYYLAKLFFDRFVEYTMRGEERRVLLFALEEAQNYAPNLSQYQVGFSIARGMLHTIATQGRKFGLALAVVTQRPRYVDPVVLSMMNTFIIHRVPPGDVGFVEQVTGGLPRGIRAGLATMEKGTAIIVGQMNPAPLPTIARVRRRRRHEVSKGGMPC